MLILTKLHISINSYLLALKLSLKRQSREIMRLNRLHRRKLFLLLRKRRSHQSLR